MYEHLRTLSASHWLTVAIRLVSIALSFVVLRLLVLNMGLTLTIFGPVLTMIVFTATGLRMWLAVERIGDILDPRRVPPHGDGAQETTPTLSPRLRHLQGGPRHVH